MLIVVGGCRDWATCFVIQIFPGDRGFSKTFSSVVCQAGTVLYVPEGWLVLEVVTKGPLCFGLRKSVFLKSHKGGYEKVKGLLAADKRDVSKMDQILGLFGKPGPAEQQVK